MNATRVESLSTKLTRGAALLALAALPLFGGACIAQTGTPEGAAAGVTDDGKGGGTVTAQGGVTQPSGHGPVIPPGNPPGTGPVLGPIPSPWEPGGSNGNSSTGGGTGSPTGPGGPSEEPVPSPWMNPATTATTGVSN